MQTAGKFPSIDCRVPAYWELLVYQRCPPTGEFILCQKINLKPEITPLFIIKLKGGYAQSAE